VLLRSSSTAMSLRSNRQGTGASGWQGSMVGSLGDEARL
jgi:hypothetical protein